MNGLVSHLSRECYPIQWGEYCILEEETMYLQGGKTTLWGKSSVATVWCHLFLTI